MACKREKICLVLTAFVGAGLSACDRSTEPVGGELDTGKVSIALTASGASGTTYRLVSPSFLITGNYPSTFSALLTGDAPTLEQALAPGGYLIQLINGYTLNQIAPDGTETPVPATLESQNPLAFGIRSQHVTPVSFQFKVGGTVVATGDGTVTVGATVDDGLIDDFEDGEGHIANIAGRSGTWFTFNDGTGTQTPVPMSSIVPEVDPYSTNFFLRSTGTGFATGNGSPNIYGAGVGADLLEVAGGPVPYDASKYGGIVFSYSLSSASYAAQIRFNVGTSATTPLEFGGTCTVGCYDDFGFTLAYPSYYYCSSYSGSLCTVTVPFSQLTQVGFGTPATFDPATVLMVKWGISWPYSYTYPPTTNSFDFKLDDVSLVLPSSLSNGAGGSFGGTGGAGTGGAPGTGGSFGRGGDFGRTGGAPFLPGAGGSFPVSTGGFNGAL